MATKKKPKLVRMVRNLPAYPGGPLAADVHPLEVPGFELAGWFVEGIPADGVPTGSTDSPPDSPTTVRGTTDPNL